MKLPATSAESPPVIRAGVRAPRSASRAAENASAPAIHAAHIALPTTERGAHGLDVATARAVSITGAAASAAQPSARAWRMTQSGMSGELRRLDSNQHRRIQSPQSYPWTTPETGGG